MKKKVLFVVTALVIMLSLTACGDKNPKMKAADGSVVTFLDAPVDLLFEETEDGVVLTWNQVDNAAGYVVYAGQSRYSNDYEKVSKPVKTNEIKLDKIETDKQYYKVAAVNGDTVSELSEAYSEEMKIFGPNTYIFSDTDNEEAVQEILTKLFYKTETAQFEDKRFAIMFKPGTYPESLKLEMGFYMDVFGLGKLPTDTVLPYLNCPATWLGDSSNHNATCNFWRGVSNLTVSDSVMFAVSQATFMRRVQIDGMLSLCDNGGWSSGGFLANSKINGTVDSGSQQQWLSRNCNWEKWTGQNWNMVFQGIEEGKAPTSTWPIANYTDVGATEYEAEKPFLYLDGNEYKVFLPAIKENTYGISWGENEEGKEIPLSDFFVANPDTDTADTINEALSEGKHILLTPGIYKTDKAIIVNNPDTIIMGIGYATIRTVNGNVGIEVSDVDGVRISGILFDAWEENSETLLRVGETGAEVDHSQNPTVLNDVFFRVGGVSTNKTSAESCIIINSNNVIGDNFWVWRADHGNGVGWDYNYAKNGIIVNGDDVSVYALMVEHFEEYQTIWNGENGTVVFYQSEIPYDVPNQAAWCSENGTVHGYSSYYVDPSVKKHTASGIGIYLYNRDAIVELYSAMKVPEVEGMNITNVCDVVLNGNPGISYVINNYGKHAYKVGTRCIITNFYDEVKERLETFKEE